MFFQRKNQLTGHIRWSASFHLCRYMFFIDYIYSYQQGLSMIFLSFIDFKLDLFLYFFIYFHIINYIDNEADAFVLSHCPK